MWGGVWGHATATDRHTRTPLVGSSGVVGLFSDRFTLERAGFVLSWTVLTRRRRPHPRRKARRSVSGPEERLGCCRTRFQGD